jgi:hypothetical protein
LHAGLHWPVADAPERLRWGWWPRLVHLDIADVLSPLALCHLQASWQRLACQEKHLR